MMLARVVLSCFAAFVALAAPSRAADLYNRPDFASLAGDRVSRNVGDIVTIVIYENATATNSAQNVSGRNNSLQGQISAGSPMTGGGLNEAGNLAMGSTSNTGASTTRAGQMIAQVSVTVDQVFPNGDLHVSGSQLLTVNGEKTKIHVSGRVRPADITPSNIVLSSSLADAQIDYDGAGFVSSSAEPGLLTRALNWLGLP